MITLATLEDATAQEVFDQVATHLLTQNERSTDSISCRYRGYNNTRCAGGCLISNEEYDPMMEGMSWKGVVRNFNFIDAHKKLIRRLQNLHDGEEVRLWYYRLYDISKEYNLSPEVLEKFKV